MDIETLSKLDIGGLNGLEQIYIREGNTAKLDTVRAAIASKGPVQTDSLANCGKLYEHVVPVYGDTAKKMIVRQAVEYTGDIKAAFAPFLRQGTGCKLAEVGYRQDGSPCLKAEMKTVSMAPGERIASNA
jgi:hypothetical protein